MGRTWAARWSRTTSRWAGWSPSNLTRGRGGLPADYTDQDFVRALTHGVKRDGRSVIFMPVVDYRFTAEDLGAIVAYVKSMPPVDRTLPTMSVGPMARALGLFVDFPLASASLIDHSQPRLAARPDPVGRGRDRQVPGVERRLLRAATARSSPADRGPPPGGANITPVGIGGWSERDFVVALRTHRRPNGSPSTRRCRMRTARCPMKTSPGSTPTCGPCRPPARRRRTSRRRRRDREAVDVRAGRWRCARPRRRGRRRPRENGVAYQRAIAAAERTLQAWLRDADPKTTLMPDRVDGTARVATPHNFAADLYPYLILTARLTDPALYEGRMMEMLRNEVRYMTADGVGAGQPRPAHRHARAGQPVRRWRVRQGRPHHRHRAARPHAVVPSHGRPDRRRDGPRAASSRSGASSRPSTAS